MALGPQGKVQILTICTGNICRSPMAEALLKKKIGPKLAKYVHVASAGTHAMEGMPASHTGIATAVKMNVDLSLHSSQPLTPYLIGRSDIILAMQPEHVKIVLRLAPTAGPRTFLLKEFGMPKGYNPQGSIIDDPIAQSDEFYDRVYKELDAEIDRIIPYLKKVVASAI
ncbi:hypothetical protein KKA00_11255 [bacterium]|nr:hypothetical protein [bacterium]MBU1652791.1 hypothetical protein [bacterium]